MKKPIREDYYNSPHLQHLSVEKREEVYQYDYKLYRMQQLEEKGLLKIHDTDEIII